VAARTREGSVVSFTEVAPLRSRTADIEPRFPTPAEEQESQVNPLRFDFVHFTNKIDRQEDDLPEVKKQKK
jgi:hypothetical protein